MSHYRFELDNHFLFRIDDKKNKNILNEIEQLTDKSITDDIMIRDSFEKAIEAQTTYHTPDKKSGTVKDYYQMNASTFWNIIHQSNAFSTPLSACHFLITSDMPDLKVLAWDKNGDHD